MKIVQKSVKDLIPYAKNAKKHSRTQIANVAESIKQYGFVQPVVIDRDGVIIIGHCRTLAAKQLGMKEIPCVCVEDLTPEQVKALRLVDNKSNESGWDMELLGEELKDLDLFAGSGTTIMACEQNGRNAYCMEFDPKFVDVIIDRWEKFTGEKAVLIRE